MNYKKSLFAICMVFSSACYSQDDISTGDYIADALFYRPGGFFTLLLGTTAFVISLPTTLAASLFPPHDALLQAGKEMVVDQAQYTFTRPFGVINPVRGDKEKPYVPAPKD